MYYRFMIIVESFPQTANGKLDRNALPSYIELDKDEIEEDILNISTHSTSSSKTMAEHICDVILAIKGRRPNANAYFTSLGVDSLGAVLFIRYLSDSLGGFRIDPLRMYTPHVTIASFADELYSEVSRDNPTILDQLQIVSDGTVGLRCLESGAKINEAGPLDVEADFDSGLLANRKLLEGIRGVLTCLVLWDHYHHPSVFSADAIQADTSLFVILSGFTTAVQLRDPPQSNEKKTIVKHRASFNWRTYILGRAVGIFPSLWVALLVNAPFWIAKDCKVVSAGEYTTTRALQCVPLYLIGMQSWFRPQCRHLGPNTVLYASIILNVFLLYGAIRSQFSQLQDSVIKGISAPSNGDRKDFRTRIRDFVTMAAFNRPTLGATYILCILWFLFLTSILLLYWRFMGWKNAVTYLPYFMAGIVTASIIESIHWSLWNKHLTLDKWYPVDLLPSPKSTQPLELSALSDSMTSTMFKRTRSVLWRFLPDVIAIFCTVIMSSDGGGSHQIARLRTWILVPYIWISYIIVVSLQRGNDRINFTRYFLESAPMNLLGYISYPICKHYKYSITRILTLV
jgi:hypothetical protein